MTAVDSLSGGSSVRVSGAALAGGPALVLGPGRRLETLVRRADDTGGSAFQGHLRQTYPLAAGQAADVAGAELTPRPELYTSQWGIPAFFGGAPYGPPYELANRTAEWMLSAETLRLFRPVDEQSRMAQRVHPRGPSLHSAGTFLNALYGTGASPRYLGVALDADA